MARMVLLLHELPDGSSHYDWMIQRPTPQGGPEPRADERCLLTFRVIERIDAAVVAGFLAHRLEDHRYHYLSHDGPIGDSRGSVKRVAAGQVSRVEETPGAISIRCKFDVEPECVWVGKHAGDLWRFERETAPDS